MKLLIVDAKDAATHEALRAQLEATGHAVLQATDAVAAHTVIEALARAGTEGATAEIGSRAAPAAEQPNPELRAKLEPLEGVQAEMPAPNRDSEARLREQSAALERANRDLRSFSYSVSHDLRAPLRAIGGFTDIVLRDHSSHIPPDAARLLERVVANVARMNQLIDQLLEFTRVGSSPLNVQSIDVSRMVRECLVALDAERPDSKAKITIGELPPCHADLLLLKQVVLILLSNALKYSGKRDPALIDFGAEVRGAEFIYHVRDNGVGFDMRMAHKLFQLFQRLHSQRDFDGTGVGLAIVRRVIERHGGRVWADSAPDRGATFYFSLPAGGPPEAADG